jgi:hypothetical protein
MSAFGTKRTCRGRLTMSAPEGKTDVPREPEHFRFLTEPDIRTECPKLHSRAARISLGNETV